MLWMTDECVIGFKLRLSRLDQQSFESVLLALRRLKQQCDNAVTICCITLALALFDTASIQHHNIYTINTSKIIDIYLRPMVTYPKKLRVEIQCNEQDICELA